MTTSIAALILFFEKPHQTIECIKSLLPYGIDIYVLNNGSSSTSRKVVGEFAEGIKRLHIIDSPTNLGVAGGRNRLIQEARGYSWLLFLDSDMICCSPDMLDSFNQCILNNEDADAIAGYWYEIHTQEPGLGMIFTYDEEYNGTTRTRFKNMPGGVTFIKSDVFSRIGPLNADMHIGLEDYELTERAKRQGYELVVLLEKNIKFIHDHRNAKSIEDKKAALYRYDIKNYEESIRIMKEEYGWESPKDTAKALEEQKHTILSPTVSGCCSSTPSVIGLYMSPFCNFKCLQCYRNTIGFHTQDLEMRLSTVKKIESTYPTVDDYVLAGQGEPTFSSEFSSICEYLFSKGKKVYVISNGTNPEPILHSIQYIKRISISLYGSSNEKYIKYCNVPAFDKVMTTYMMLQSSNVEREISYILDKFDLDELSNVLDLCDDLAPSLLTLHNTLWYDLKDGHKKTKIISQYDKTTLEKISSLCTGRAYPIKYPTIPDFTKPVNSCRSYFHAMSIDGNGNIAGCRRQYTPSKIFGNIFTDPDSFNSEEMMRLRRNQQLGYPAHPECVYCFGNWIPENI